jgi:hypothetical protein
MIKGLIPQLAERGKIKIGEKGPEQTSAKGKKWRLPVKLDHFIITTMERDKEDQLIRNTGLMDRLFSLQSPAMQETRKLREIPIRLLYDEIELNFQTRLACYRSCKLTGETVERLRCWCSGDNEKAQRLQQDGAFQEINCPCERCEPGYDKADKCKFLGTLQCLIDGTDRIGGVWKFRTTGWNSVNAIYASLLLIKDITGGGRRNAQDMPIGPLAGIPLKMVISPKTVMIPAGPQKGQNQIIQVVSIEYAGSLEALARLGFDMGYKRVEHHIRMTNLEHQARRAIVSPHEEPPELQEETGREIIDLEPEPFPEDTTTQDLAEFSQRLADHGLLEDGPVTAFSKITPMLKFLESKAKEHGKTLDEIRVAAVADWESFWDDFEVFRQAQKDPGSNGGSQEGKEGKITEITMGIIREQISGSKKYKDLSALLHLEGVENLNELSEARGQQIVDGMNAL